MAIEQKSYFCPVCQQQRLFTRQLMNHTPHILASVFLCGLWLPLWLITAVTYNARYHCATCGFTDRQKYLANPNLRQLEEAQKESGQPNNASESVAHWFRGLDDKQTIGICIIAVVVIVGVLIGLAKVVGISPASQPVVNRTAKEQASYDLLAAAKRSLENQANFTDRDYNSVSSILIQIPPDAAEYPEAQKILKQYDSQIQSAKQNLYGSPVTYNSANKLTSKPTPEDPNVDKVIKAAYKIGLQGGRNRPAYVTDDTEVKNTAQVRILAESAADLVYKPNPQYRGAWVVAYTKGFITGYNQRRPDAPIRTITGTVATETNQ